MTDRPLDITAFIKLILATLKAAKVEHLIYGTIAE